MGVRSIIGALVGVGLPFFVFDGCEIPGIFAYDIEGELETQVPHYVVCDLRLDDLGHRVVDVYPGDVFFGEWCAVLESSWGVLRRGIRGGRRVVADIVAKNRPAAVALEIEVSSVSERAEEELDATVFANTFLIAFSDGSDVPVLNFEEAVDRVAVIKQFKLYAWMV